MSAELSLLAKRVCSALFYAFCSFFIIVVNKIVLTNYHFPAEVLALGQVVATIVVLYLARLLGVIDFPPFTKDAILKIFPLPVFFFGNLVCGLGSTKQLNLPMFTVLRRFSILMTMLLERFMLGTERRWEMQVAVYLMIVGALVAAWNDLSYNTLGYMLVLINDLTTALNGVYTMKKLQVKTCDGQSGSHDRTLGKYGILYYNALFMLIPTVLLAQFTGSLEQAYLTGPWLDPIFVLQFAASCMMGFILNYSVVLCTQLNTALTTTIVGVLKNIVITYLGMFIGGDYIFSVMNFVGLNISAIASVGYSYYEFLSEKKPNSQKEIVVKPVLSSKDTKTLEEVA